MSYLQNIFVCSIVFSLLMSCDVKKDNTPQMNLTLKKEDFGRVDGETVHLYTIENGHGVKVAITNYGGIITQIHVPDRNGNIEDIVLGFDNLQGYLSNHPYFGAIVGRYGNRIANGAFSINGKNFTLPINNGPNSLHGGINGFDKKVWQALEISTSSEKGVELSYLSKDGEEGYPGNLQVTVRYTLNLENELGISYTAKTDSPTILNLTNHSYFNLRGAGNGDILGHQLKLYADQFTPVDSTLIPTGEYQNVQNGPFDFTTQKAIGKDIESEDIQIQYGGGYDHNFVLSKNSGELKSFAKVFEPKSGRVMEVFTTEPGVQFYTGNFLDGSIIGKMNKPYKKQFGFCLETQHFPDSPNHSHFPTTTLLPDEKYHSETVYKFSML